MVWWLLVTHWPSVTIHPAVATQCLAVYAVSAAANVATTATTTAVVSLLLVVEVVVVVVG